MPRWLLITGGVVMAAILTACIVLLIKWPFTRTSVTTGLEQAFNAQVEIGNYRSTYFPGPGFVAENVTLRGHHFDATIARLTFVGHYATFLTGQKRVALVRAEGLYVAVTRSDGKDIPKQTASPKVSGVVVSEVVADGSVLEIKRDGKDPLRFEIHELTLNNVGKDRAVSYRAAVRNPEPPGEVHSSGTLGPLKLDDPGSTPISGSYTFQHADLGMFHIIAGTLSSRGQFSGVLQHIDVHGSTELPDFEVTSSGHSVQLSAQFHGIVNGTNGDVALQLVNAHFDRTEVTSDGVVDGTPGQRGKTVSLDMAIRQGRIQDLMMMFMKSNRPPMDGIISLRAKVSLPPTKENFLKKLEMNGDFGVVDARFTGPGTRKNIDILSERARGDKHDDGDPADVISDLKGHVDVRNGMANFTNISFTVPGAVARLDGTFNLLSQQVNLSGTLAMQAELSQATKGVKSFLLKALDPLFKKKHAGAMIPIKITGTFQHPSYGIAWGGHKSQAALTGDQSGSLPGSLHHRVLPVASLHHAPDDESGNGKR